MKPLTKALIEGLTACDSDEMIIKTLVNMGFTPPPIKPDPPREPVRAWAVKKHGKRVGIFYSQNDALISASAGEGNLLVVPLIEAGYCQMVPHDGSDKCPVDPDATVIYMNNIAQGITQAYDLTWRVITHYAVILPTE